ncbi:MAG: hypothetical protein IBJ15_16835 [Alphaproteobacteria bacterium]|nr:hypothetical protein [Alphaproteobacteria bacterium]
MSPQVSSLKRPSLKRSAAVALVLAAALFTSACQMTQTENRVATGAAIGTGVGAAASIIGGGVLLTNTLVGAGVGAAGGWLYDQAKKK